MIKKPIVGKVFGRYTVLSEEYVKEKRSVIAECECICGTVKKVKKGALVSGRIKSCGCLLRDASRARVTTHGLSKHPLYYTWKSMKDRCFNPNHKQFKDWGGRGITVCDEWKNDAKGFIEWALANGWEKGLAIDRTNNEGNYEPSNCRFVTQTENNKNRREQIKISNSGERNIYFVDSSKRFMLKIKNKHIGSYKTLEEAVAVRNKIKGEMLCR